MIKIEKYLLHDSSVFWMEKLYNLAKDNASMELQQYDITPSQWSVLVPVQRGIIVTVSALAKHLGKDKAAISRTVSILEKKGLLERRKDPEANDRRSMKICLTKKGEALIPQIIESARSSDERFFDGLDHQEIYRLKDAISKIQRNQDSRRI